MIHELGRSSDGRRLKLRQMLFVVLLPNGMVVEPKVARRFQTQIDELKGTNRVTAPTREKILERIKDAMGMVNQYVEDLRNGFRMHPGVGVGLHRQGGGSH